MIPFKATAIQRPQTLWGSDFAEFDERAFNGFFGVCYRFPRFQNSA